MLPQSSEVLFVDAHSVSHDARHSQFVGQCDIQVGDVTDAVAAQLQLIDVPTEEVFPGVEVVLPKAVGRRIRIGHDHFADRSPGHHGPLSERHLTDDQALAGVESESQPPVSPCNLFAINGEARPLWLRDLNELQPLQRCPLLIWTIEVAAGFGNIESGRVHDLDDLASGRVDVCGESVYGMGPGMIGRIVLPEGECAEDATALLGWEAVVACRQGNQHHVVDGQPPGRESSDPARVLVRDDTHLLELGVQDRELPGVPIQLRTRQKRASPERHDGIHGVPRRSFQELHSCRALGAFAPVLPAEDGGLRGLFTPDVGKPYDALDDAQASHDVADRVDLVRRERAQRMRGQGWCGEFGGIRGIGDAQDWSSPEDVAGGCDASAAGL